jgi:hypothetical protein
MSNLHRERRAWEIPPTPRLTTRSEVGLSRDDGVPICRLVRVPSYPRFNPPASEWHGLDALALLFQLPSTFNPFSCPPALLRYGSIPGPPATFTLRGNRSGGIVKSSLFSLHRSDTNPLHNIPPLSRLTPPIQVQGPPPDRSAGS